MDCRVAALLAMTETEETPLFIAPCPLGKRGAFVFFTLAPILTPRPSPQVERGAYCTLPFGEGWGEVKGAEGGAKRRVRGSAAPCKARRLGNSTIALSSSSTCPPRAWSAGALSRFWALPATPATRPLARSQPGLKARTPRCSTQPPARAQPAQTKPPRVLKKQQIVHA
jgi:hypothetical protein